MGDYRTRIAPQFSVGMPAASMTDLYRAKYHMPLDGETHERYIATKSPPKKNKDYRGRYRNYSLGFPVT